MKVSNVYMRAQEVVLNSKYNLHGIDIFSKELTRFLNTYGNFEGIAVSYSDDGKTLVLTFTVKNFNSTLAVKV